MARKNYFELLNQPQTFAVDSLSLQKAKTLLLARLHPDRFVNAGPVEKRLAEQMSVQVNEAYQTLSDDVKRGWPSTPPSRRWITLRCAILATVLGPVSSKRFVAKKTILCTDWPRHLMSITIPKRPPRPHESLCLSISF